MSVHQTKDGRWHVKYYINGKAKKEYFGRGLEGEQKAHDRDQELKSTKIIKPYTRRSTKVEAPTFGALANEYITAKTADISKSSLKNLWYKLTGVILPEIGHIQVTRLTHKRLDQYVQKRLATPVTKRIGSMANPKKVIVKDQDGSIKMTSRSTVHRELSDIQAILNWGVQRKYFLQNPVMGHRKPQRDDEIIPPLTEAETKSILAHASPHLVRALYLSFYTGLRPGQAELFGITWDHVDWKKKTIFIISAKKGGPSYRNIPIHSTLMKKLEEWHQADKTNRHIITWKDQPVKSVKKSFNAAKVRAGITRRIRMYDFRHAAITHMLSQGGDLKSVSEIAGHSRTDTTTKIYHHTNTALLRQQIDRLPDLDQDDSEDED